MNNITTGANSISPIADDAATKRNFGKYTLCMIPALDVSICTVPLITAENNCQNITPEKINSGNGIF